MYSVSGLFSTYGGKNGVTVGPVVPNFLQIYTAALIVLFFHTFLCVMMVMIFVHAENFRIPMFVAYK